MVTFPATMAPLRLAIVLFASASAVAAPPMYRITLIPDLPGEHCQVLGLNDVGQATGRCSASGFIWSSAQGTQKVSDPRFPDSQFEPYAINNQGTVAGIRDDGDDGRNFTWGASDGFTYFGTRAKLNELYSINDLGVVVGYRAVRDGNFIWKAFKWSAATGDELLRPHADRRTLAYGINNNGEVAGSIQLLPDGITHAVRFEADGGATRLFPGDRSRSYAKAINQLGHVAGTRMNLKKGRPQAFVWTPQTGGVDIDDRPLRTDTSNAMAINDAGQVVGYMMHEDANGNTQEGAFYWDATNGFFDLRSLLDPDDPLTGQLSEVHADAGMRINASGQIAVNGFSTGGQYWSMVLVPVK